MSVESILGLNDYTLVRTSKGWDKDKGSSISREYHGPIEKIDNLYESLIGDISIDTIDRTTQMGKGVLIITAADDENPNNPEENDLWEVVGQDLYKDLRSHQTYNQDADQADLEEVRRAIETVDLNFAEPANEPEKSYHKLLLRGVDQYVRTTAILQRSIQAGPRSLLKASWTGVDKAWKISGEDGSPNLRTTGDAAIIGYLQEMPEYDENKKQWLKRAPQLRQVGKRRFALVYQWWYARRWSHSLYDGDNEDGNP